MSRQTRITDLTDLLAETQEIITRKRFDGQKHDSTAAITAAIAQFRLLADELKPWYKRWRR